MRAQRRRTARKMKDKAWRLWKYNTRFINDVDGPSSRDLGKMASVHFANKHDREGADFSSNLRERRAELSFQEELESINNTIDINNKIDHIFNRYFDGIITKKEAATYLAELSAKDSYSKDNIGFLISMLDTYY